VTSTIAYVSGSTHAVCTLTGTPNQAQADQTTTAQAFGLQAADRGYSFTYNGNTWFIFGDSQPTKDFPVNSNTRNAATRYPKDNAGLDNDSMAYASPTPPGSCPHLSFIPQPTAAVGAYTSPSLMFNGQPVSLRTNETPVAGISEGGKMYVIFATGNACDVASPPDPVSCTGTGGGFGHPTVSVMAVLSDQRTLRFTGLYDFSTPSTTFGNDAKFVMVAMQQSADGYVYIWGTGGGSSSRMSPPYLARVPAADIASQSALQYYEGSTDAGAPIWSARQSDASALFNDSPNCMGELGVEWDSFVQSWVMLYNCTDDSGANPRGIWMRTAPQPWGPWSAAQTVFSSKKDGFCVVIDNTGCPAPYNGDAGGDYGPYFIDGWTTGSAATAKAAATSTFYYTVDTFHPYGQVIEKSTIAGSRS
jgi:hypothetical protein